ncbi:MAG TPA: M28 family peptidase [Vicinamibacterales bacterium]|jgi:hypothetical protein
MTRRKTSLAIGFSIILAAVLVAPMAAQSKAGHAATAAASIKVDGKVIKGYIDYLAADDKQGRQTLTPGYEKTAEWAAAKFKEWGLKPAGDNGTFLQNVPITGPRTDFAWTSGIPELVVDGRAFHVRDSDFALDARSTPGAQASGEIVFVGYGISAPAKGLDEYAGIDVKGRIVLAFKGSPKDAPPARGMFGVAPPQPKNPEPWADESRDNAKVATAYDKGAAGIILFSPDKLQAPNPFAPAAAPSQAQAIAAFMGRPAVEASAFTRPFLVVGDCNERVFRQVMYRNLEQESPRGFVSRISDVRRDIRDKKPRSQTTGVKALIKGYASVTFYGERFKNNISHNVIGKVEGTDPRLKSQYIVVGGHLDHVGTTDGVVYNGADDDASGSALTMEMARLMAANAATIKPKRTIVFALWCGEEMGLIGSNYWTKTPSDGVKMENVVVNFNGDMVGLGDRIDAPGALNFPAIFDVIMRNQDPDVAKVVDASTGGPGGSDFSGFIEQGIESLALMTSGGAGHPDYHDAGDKAAKIDPEILRKTGQFVLQGLINVANDNTTAMIVPDRLHLYNGMRLNPINIAEVRPGGRAVMFGGQNAPIQGPRFNISLNDTTAFGGNLALIDTAAKLLGVGRVEVTARGDGAWFTPGGLTDRGRTALDQFESSGVVVTLVNPSMQLLDDMLDAAKKPFILTGAMSVPAAPVATRLKTKNVLMSVEFDATAPQAVASKLIDLKNAIGGSDGLLLTTRESVASSPMGEPVVTDAAKKRRVDEAKQQMYLALIKAGWTKDEIYAMVGVNPPQTGPMQMPPPNAGRLGGNLKKLGQ